MAKKSNAKLLERARALAEDLRRFTFFAGTEQGLRFDALKVEALALLDGKLLPELAAELELPLFVAVLGGTNTGKSTLFNALAGVLLSETKITAGATKHPLVYVHRRWRDRLLSGEVFDRVRCLEVENPAQAILTAPTPQMLFSFHDRDELRDVAFVDSPDFDSVEPHNREVAHLVLTQADVCLFMTTPQKYKDRVLVEDLSTIVERRKRVVVVFNFVDDEMVWRTMVDDLKQRVPGEVGYAGFLPQVDTRHPERKLEERVRAMVKGFLDGLSRAEVKKQTLAEALEAMLGKVRQLVDGYRAEAGHKGGVRQALERETERVIEAYRQAFALEVPEVGEALRRKLAGLELRALFPAERSATLPGGLGLAYRAAGTLGDAIGKLMVESLEPDRAPARWELFREKRDQQDLLQVKQLAQLLRARIDNHLRASAAHSALCLALLKDFFTAESLERFDGDLEAAHAQQRADEVDLAEALLERTPDPRAGARRSRAAVLGANGLKLTTGVALASATGGIGVWDLVFFPLGFLAGSYALALALFGLLRRQKALFAAQRERWFRAVLGEVLIAPLRARVDSVASEEDLSTLQGHCDAIAELKP